ncbi:hypothetical protein D3C72_2197400 [compost metagenome]
MTGVDDALCRATHRGLLHRGGKGPDRTFELGGLQLDVQARHFPASLHPDAVMPVDHDLGHIRRFDVRTDWCQRLKEHRNGAGFELAELQDWMGQVG